jgi:acetylornithine deacetylase/succinyl-diaminopimelate desuccinylase-like protein
MDVREYVAANAAEFSLAMREWLAIPSVSADPAHHGDVRRSADWLAGYLKKTGFPEAEVWETAGLPAVYAHWPAAGDQAPRGPEADLADILGAPLLFVAVGLDADRIHAPNEYVDLSRLLRGAEAVAYLWEELAAGPVAS